MLESLKREHGVCRAFQFDEWSPGGGDRIRPPESPLKMQRIPFL